jgi:hypothetical protein
VIVKHNCSIGISILISDNTHESGSVLVGLSLSQPFNGPKIWHIRLHIFSKREKTCHLTDEENWSVYKETGQKPIQHDAKCRP